MTVPDDDVLTRYLEAGMVFLALTQQRAEALMAEVTGTSGASARARAQKAAEWVAERGRKGTEDLLEAVRREIREQVAALGLATKEDIARLEARLVEMSGSGSVETAPPVGAAPVDTAPVKTAPVKTAPVKTAPVKTAPVKTASSEQG